ncbi:unnamed protein product [Closterium sp. NIES-54]
MYGAVVARYSSSATAAIGRLLLPYLFPELLAFATVADLVTHLCTSNARYRATVPAEFLPTNQPPMFITLYFIVTHLPDSLCSIKNHFLNLDPTSLTIDLLEQHLLAAETSADAVGAARGTPRSPFFEGCSPSPLSPSFASAAAADVSFHEDVDAASTSAKHRNSKGKGGRGGGGGNGGGGGGSGSSSGGGSRGGGGGGGGGGCGGTSRGGGGSGGGGGSSGGSGGSGGGGTCGVASERDPDAQQLREWLVQRGTGEGSETCPYVIRTGVRASQTCGKYHTERHCFARLDDAWRAEFGDDVEHPHWAQLLRSGVAIFDLDYDVIISAMYALSFSAEGDCYWCVPTDPGIAAVALAASASGTPPGTAPAEALHTFTLDSGASRYFFRDSTTLTPLPAPVPVRLADPSGGPDVASSSTVLPCLAVPSGSLSGLHLPSFSTNLVSTAALQDAMVTTTTPGGQRVSICTCTRMGRHLATFTRRPGSSLYKLANEPPQVAASAQVSASGQVTASCSCRLLSHQTLLRHHRLGHPSLPRLRGMQSRFLVSGLPRSLPPLLTSPAPPCLPCVKGRQRAAPHSSSFPPTTASLQTLQIDVWGPARVSGHGRERYFLLSVSSERFGQDLLVLRLHSDRGGEFSSNLLRDFFMEVARTSMIHAAAPHFLWPFAVQYAAHQLNLWPRVSLPETSPTLRWTGKVGDASVFQVWGSRAFVRDTSADKLSARAIPCVFLGFVPDAPGWHFYHPTSHRVLPSQKVTFDKSVPFYHLFPYRSAPLPPPPLFLAPGPPPVDPLPPQGPAPSGVSQVDPLPGPAPVQVTVVSGAAPGAASGGAASGGAEPGGAGSEGARSGGAEPEGVEPGGAESEGAEPGGAESEGAESGGTEPRGAASSGGPAGASPRLSLHQLHEWLVQRAHRRSGAPGAGEPGDTGAGGAAITTGAGDPTEPGAAGAGGTRAGVAGVGGPGAGGARSAGAGVGGTSAGGAGAVGAGAVDPGAGGARGTVRPRPYFVPLLQEVLGVPSSTSLPPPFLCPPPDQSQPPLQPASPLPVPPPYTEQSGGLTECREPAPRPVSLVRTARRTPIPGTHTMALCPSSVPLRVPLPAPPVSSLSEAPDPESDRARAANPTFARLLATAFTDPSFESAAASALDAEQLDFAAACRLDYASALVAESVSASPPSVGGECALSTDVLEDRQEDFECLAAAVPRFASLLLAPEGHPDAPDIPTPRSYAEAITGPHSSQWQAAMDAEMASWKSTGTYVDEVPPPGANIVDGMWIFRVKRPPVSPPAFKARYVARGFSLRQGVDYFHNFSPTPKMTTLRVLLHVAAQRDYELHSLDFSTAFLQGSLHEEIWLRRPPGFTGTFPAGTQWSLRRPVYGLRQAPREWHDTLRTTLAALGFAPSTADPSLFLRTDTSLPPFYVLVYVDDLVFATGDTEALTLVKSELQKRHTCTDLGELRSYLGLLITRDRARRTITLTLSHMVHQVLQRFGFQYSSPQLTPLSTIHSLSAPPLDESVEPSGPYPELVGCLMYLMTCTRPDLAYPISLLVRYVAPGRHRKVHSDAAKRLLRYLCSTSRIWLVLGGRGPVVLTSHADASWVDDSATRRSSQGYTFSLGSGSVSWRSTRSSSVLSSSCEAEIYAEAMAAQELRWLTFLLTNLGEQPRSPPVLYIDNKAMIALCQEHRLEHRTKDIALRYFLARDLQQHGQLHLAYVATWANTADVFTKALPPGDHQRFVTVLGLCSCIALPVLPSLPAYCPAGCVPPCSTRYHLPLAVRNHLPLAERAQFRQHKTSKALYEAVVTRYSSPATAALGRLILPYLFPELSAFATVEGLITHLQTSDTRCGAALTAEFLDKNPPPMYITLYFIVTRLLDSLRAVRDHFLALDPTDLTVDLLENHLLAAETSIVADVGAASAPSGKRSSSKGKGGKTSGGGSGRGGGGGGGGGEVAEVAVGVVAGVGASVAVVGVVAAAVDTFGVELFKAEVLAVAKGSSSSVGPRPVRPSSFVSGLLSVGHLGVVFAACMSFAQLLRSGIDMLALDYDAILAAMYALTVSAEGDCYLCVPPDPGKEAAALGASECALPSTAPAEALHTFTLDSDASRRFSRVSTTLTPLPTHVPIRLADPSRGPVLAHSSTVLPCPAVPSGSLLGLHLPSFSTNLVSTAALQDAMVTTTTLGGQRVTIRTCTRTGRHLATFTRRPGSSLYKLTTLPPQVAASGQLSVSGKVAAPCSYRLLSHQTLFWHHRLGHPSLPRLRGMHSRLLVSGLPRSLPPLPPSPALPCLPCVEGQQRAAPHSSSFPPTTAPLQTLHMDVWGPARISGQGRERYFLLVVDDYMRYTTVFPLRGKGEVPDVLIPWIRAVRLQLRERFRVDLPVLRLHSDRGGEFSSDLLRDICRGEGILQSFTLPASLSKMAQPLAPCLLAGDFADTALDGGGWRCIGVPGLGLSCLCSRYVRGQGLCVFLSFPPGAPGWHFYHPTSRCVFPSLDITFDESVPFYRLFPYCSAPPPPPPLFLAPGPPPVAVDSCAASGCVASKGAELAGAKPGGAEPASAEPGDAEPASVEPRGAEPEGAEPGGAETEGAEPGGAESQGAESGGAEPRGTASAGGPVGASPRQSRQREPFSPRQLREWCSRHTRLRSAGAGGPAIGGTGAGGAGAIIPRGAGVTAVAGGIGGAGAAGPGGARTRGTGAAGAHGVGGAGAGDPGDGGTRGAGARGAGAGGTGDANPGAGGFGAGDPRAGGAGAGGARAGGAGAGGARAGGTGAGGVGAGGGGTIVGGAGDGDPGARGAGTRGAGAGGTGAGGTLDSPLPAPSPYAEQTDSLTEHREPESRTTSPVRAVCTGRRVPRPRPPHVPGTHIMALRPSSVPLRIPLPSPPAFSLADGPNPESDLVRATSPSVTHLLTTIETDPSFESAVASALVAELVDFAATSRLDYAASLAAESKSDCPPSIGGECALGTDVLEDRQEDFECLASAVPHLVAMLLAPEGHPDAPVIPTSRSYAEAITGPYSSLWQKAMDTEMASWNSIGTYVDEVPPSGANIVDGMWIFRVKRPLGSPTVFKARYVARGFSQRHKVVFFQTFSPTPKMTTLRVLLHVAAQCD